jgi:DMSO/TMAO reductase YedYZ molybdopterin-dependent catalytic subunit
MAGLEYVTTDPPNAGVPLRRFDGRPFAQGDVFKRNNFELPESGPTSFEVVVEGRSTRTVMVSDLRGMDQVEVGLVLECAGHARTGMDPVPEGTPWGMGAASPIVIRGVPLGEVLEDLPEDVVDVVFTGIDHGEVPEDGEVNYQFSLSRQEATRPGPVLALEMNGTPLRIEHGGPVRLVVPGQYAMKSVKWLTRIEAVAEPFEGHFVRKYRYYDDPRYDGVEPVGPVLVRAVIAAPRPGDEVPAGRVAATGMAWTGTGEVEAVELSSDGGETWTSASLERREGFVVWTAEVEVGTGPTELVARATDSAGNVQPLEAPWNRNGYGNNAVHRIPITAT